MASAIMHLCVAKRVNESLGLDEKLVSLGAIAPDLSKQVGERKNASHFLDSMDESSLPNVERFLKKYGKECNKPYEMGYLIHLLTDKYWFRDYITKYISSFKDKKKANPELNYTALKSIIYNDYTNLNVDLIDKYNLDLDLFCNEFDYPSSKITEIDCTKLPIIVEKMGLIVMDSQKREYSFVFNIDDVILFIDECTKYIIDDLKELGYIKD